MEKIDAKLLQGPALCLTTGKSVKTITMTGANVEIIEKNGRKTRKPTPWERQAQPDDVLSFKVYGDYIVVAIQDGKKYRVEKRPAPADEKTGKKPIEEKSR